MKRRSRSHDYARRGLYMLTLAVDGRRQLLGRLRGAPRPHVELSMLGRAILQDELKKITLYYPNVEVWKCMVMPDHIHMIVYVNADFPPKKHLGLVVRGFKQGCNQAYFRWCPDQEPRHLFEPGYNDRILMENEGLKRWTAYLDDNPRRLWLKRNHPELFIVTADADVAGTRCLMIGNRFLLDVPDKMAVIVHRAYSASDLERLRAQWMACGERGGVLVSAAVAPKEKEVISEAMALGYNVIQLKEKGFGEYYKPSGASFDACVAGRLLQISPWEYSTQRTKITRQQCLQLNALAEAICSLTPGATC